MVPRRSRARPNETENVTQNLARLMKRSPSTALPSCSTSACCCGAFSSGGFAKAESAEILTATNNVRWVRSKQPPTPILEKKLRILFVGDVVGRTGRDAIQRHLPSCIANWRIDLCIVNGENAADEGFGITRANYDEIVEAGADAVTLGNHSWNRREALSFIDSTPRLVRPINYLSGTPGQGAARIDTKSGKRLGRLCGTLFGRRRRR